MTRFSTFARSLPLSGKSVSAASSAVPREAVLFSGSFSRRILALLVALVTATVVVAAPVAAYAAVPNNYIFNNSSVGIGVWHDYHSGTYDGVLPAYTNTRNQWGWDHASKFFIGSGYCFNAYRRPAGSSGGWVAYHSGWGSTTWPDSASYNSSWWNYDWQIQLFRVVNGACGPRV